MFIAPLPLLATAALLAPLASAQTTPASQSTSTATVHKHVATTAKPALAHHRTRSLAPHAPVCAQVLPAPAVPANLPPAPGPVQTAFALRYVDITVGTGAETQPGDFITVHYTGWLASDGTKFDSSLDRGTPFTFPQGAHRVITGWDQGFTGMKVGGKRRLFIPYQLAYGALGKPPVIPAKSDLIFDVELIATSATPPPDAQ